MNRIILLARRLPAGILFIGLLLIPASHALSSEKPSIPDSPAALAMGNTYLACCDFRDAAVFNPACFAQDGNSLIILRTTAGLNTDALKLFFNLSDDIRQYSQEPDLDQIPDSFYDNIANLHARYRLTGPLFFLYKGEGYGLALYNTARGYIGFSGTSLPTATISADFDIGAVVGVAIPVPAILEEKLKAGINLRYVTRVRHYLHEADFSTAGEIVSPFDYGIPFAVGQALGSDIGLTYEPNKNVSVALVWNDWFSTTYSWERFTSSFDKIQVETEDTRVAPALALGVSYNIARPFGIDDDILSNTRLALDIRDLFRERDSFFNMLHMGLETTIGHTFTTRIGLNGGYLTLGLSYTFREIFTLSFTHFAEEGGSMPGQDLVAYQILSLSLYL